MTELKRPPTQTTVPLVDLRLQNDEVMEEVLASFDSICREGAFVLGPAVARFEAEYAAFCGVARCVGVGNGTDALELALLAGGIGAGDEVIVPANTFVATAEAVARVGADLVLADCGPDFLVDPLSVDRHLSSRTRAVVGVDLYGQVAPFEELRAVVGEGVLLLEDAAQSQGAERYGRAAGSLGTVAGTSFYPGKNLGAFGDAGAVTTDDAELADRVRALRNHGGVERYEHLSIGTNSRLDSLQASALSIKLRRLRTWNAERRFAADVYDQLLAEAPQVVVPRVREGNTHVWHLYVVRVPDRDLVAARMAADGIGTGLHYKTPVHLLPAFAHLGMGPGSMPVAERYAGEILSLPMYPGITVEQQVAVVDSLIAAVSS